jgi:hypothetical protein
VRSAVWSILGLAALACCGGDSSSPTGPTAPSIPADRNGRWQLDVDTFQRQLTALHANLFFQVTRAQFDSEVASLRADVPSLSDAAVVVSLMRIAALVGDAHTGIDARTVREFRQLPLRFEWFPDGVFVVGATDPYRQVLAMRVDRVGGASIEAATASLEEVIPHENDAWLSFLLGSRLIVPEVLEAQGIAPDASRVSLELSSARGETLVVEAPAVLSGPIDLVTAGPGELPLYRQRVTENYWLTVLEDSQTLYVQYRQASEGGAESVASFAARALQILDNEPLRTLVIDLRSNTGGNSSLLNPLISGLEARPRWSSGEGLYTVIGRATFSSAVINAIDLKRRARAILVGESTGGKPNSYGEVRSFNLPSSGIRVSYSTRFFRLLPDSDPPSLEPDIRVEISSQDYFAGRDPVLETILDLAGR